jgi:hypothetical protein
MLSFPDQDIAWQPPSTHPNYLVLTKLKHFMPNKTPKLVMALTRDGLFRIGPNEDPSNPDWNIEGWLPHDFEIDLLNVNAQAAQPYQLVWEVFGNRDASAYDGMGGFYQYTHKGLMSTLQYECDAMSYINIRNGKDFKEEAQKFHNKRLKSCLT